MAERRDILFRLLGDSKSLERATRSGQSALGGITGTLKKMAGAAAIAFGAREAVQWTQDAIQLASAAEEVDSKFQSVFGSAQALNDSLREWGDLAGVTETDAKNLAATFGNLALAQGLSKDTTEELTVSVAGLAGDLASFNDADPAMVFNDLNKALLTTEREGMKKYGIAIGESEVRQRALNIAIADGRDEATKGDRALASYQIAVEQAGKAVGDLERTSDSTANRQRQLRATMKETQEEIGRRLLPVYADLVEVAADFVPVLLDTADELQPVVNLFGALARAASGASDNGLLNFIGRANELAGKLNPLKQLLASTNELFFDADDGARAAADAYGEARANAVGLAGGMAEAQEAADNLNASIAAQRDYLGELDAALSGDLFGKYRRFAELQGLAAGGRLNPDWDRGEDWTQRSVAEERRNGPPL